MGRPLKISKAVLLTMTGTASATGLVTVSEDLSALNIIAGMPFTPNVTRGGLTAGTTYYVLAVASIHTFTVSATDLSQNVDFTPVSLTNSSTSTVLTVGFTDTGFNNPDNSNTAAPSGSNASFGVVGGNTGIYGKQVLANVAFGVEGQGRVIADTGSNIVVGYGTDFANIAAGTHLYAHWGDDPAVQQLLGTTTSTAGDLTVAVANTQNTGNIIGTSGNAQTLVEGGPVTFSANLGGLVTGTTYFVLNIANSSAFTVSLEQGGDPVDLSSATGTPDAVQQQVVLTDVSANNATGTNGYGDTFIQALPEAGYILRQKGKTKYLVQGTVTGIVGAAYTANVANTALTPNTMSIRSTNAASGVQYVSSVNDYQSELFPAQVAAGSLSAGTQYVIYSSGTTDWTAVGAPSNITGVTFTATASGSGTGTAILTTANPDVIATFGTAYAANTYGGQPLPIVTINNA
jgi:hypothetical protein